MTKGRDVENLAYIAGLFDSKMTVSCGIKEYRGRGAGVLSFTCTDEVLLQWIHTELGVGEIKSGIKYGGEICDQLQVDGKDLTTLLTLLEPYSMIHGAQYKAMRKLLCLSSSDEDKKKGKLIVDRAKKKEKKVSLRPNLNVRESRHGRKRTRYLMGPQIRELYTGVKPIAKRIRATRIEDECNEFLAKVDKIGKSPVSVKIFKIKISDIILTDTSRFCSECYRGEACSTISSYTIPETKNLFSRFDFGYFCCFSVSVDMLGKRMAKAAAKKGKCDKHYPGVWYYKGGSPLSPLFVLSRAKGPVNKVFNKLLVPKYAKIGSLVMSPGFINKPNTTLTERMNVNVFGMFKRYGVEFEFPVQHKLVFCGMILGYDPKGK